MENPTSQAREFGCVHVTCSGARPSWKIAVFGEEAATVVFEEIKGTGGKEPCHKESERFFVFHSGRHKDTVYKHVMGDEDVK